MIYISLFPFSELTDNAIRKVTVSGKKIIVVRQGDQAYALDDRCTHEEYALSAGFLEQGKIFCALHGAGFDLATGAVISLPACEAVRTYPVIIKDGMVQIPID
jgi:3-phenylpropionate/trans-cinnamate dioxygenase ferredoxin component